MVFEIDRSDDLFQTKRRPRQSAAATNAHGETLLVMWRHRVRVWERPQVHKADPSRLRVNLSYRVPVAKDLEAVERAGIGHRAIRDRAMCDRRTVHGRCGWFRASNWCRRR